MIGRGLSGAELAEAFGSRGGYVFRDHDSLRKALTHASAKSHPGSDYQRLEFLGDRVLGLVVAEMLFTAHPNATEGELSLRLNALVNAETLASVSDRIGVADLILAGTDIKTLAGRKRVNLRADVMESLIAAIYLEGGLEAARAFILRHWAAFVEANADARRDPKTELQEWAHQVSGTTPAYAVESRTGPDHDPVFTVSVRVKGFEPAEGEGRSKREAEQRAAAALLVRESIWTEPEA